MARFRSWVAAAAVLAFAAPAQAQVVISEVGPAGPDFVELLNTGTTGVALEGLQLERKVYTCENQTGATSLPAITLKPGQHLLVALVGELGLLVSPDVGFTGDIDQIQADGGAVWLTRTEPPEVLDKFAWGTATECGEGTVALATMAPGSSIERDGGRKDTGDNSADLVVRGLAQPQNVLTIDDRDGDGYLDDVDACIAEAGVAPAGCKLPDPVVTVEPTVVPTAVPTVVPDAVASVVPTVVADLLAPAVTGFGVTGGGTPQVGRRTSIRFTLSDPDDPVSGAFVEFGDGTTLGASSCRIAPKKGFPKGSPFAAGTPVTFSLPHTFTSAGTKTITVHPGGAGCSGAPEGTAKTFTVDVAPSTATAARASAAGGPPRARASAGCAGTATVLTAATRKAVAKALLCAINAERAKAGAPKVKASKLLGKVANGHARDMVAKRFFSHSSPTQGGFAARARRFGYKADAGENLGAGAASTALIVNAWLNSPGHRANLLDRKYKWVGIALADANPIGSPRPGGSWVTIFGTRKK